MQAARKRYREQEILERINRLSPRQQAEVVDFIDFLADRKSLSVASMLRDASESKVDIEDVRRRMAKIPGTMSETVRALRDERG